MSIGYVSIWEYVHPRAREKVTIQQSTGVSYGLVLHIVEDTFQIIKTTLAAGKNVDIDYFGRFKIKAKVARKYRNPQTGEDMMLKPRKVVRFQCSGKLRERLNAR